MNPHANFNNDETVSIPCPSCQNPLRFKSLQLLSGVTCDKCQAVIGVPAGSVHQLIDTMQQLKMQKENALRNT